MHDTFTEKISLWLDNELEAAEVAKLQNHLTTCAECQQHYQNWLHLDSLFQTAAASMVSPLPGFSHRVEERLASHRPYKLWQIWLTLAALLVGALFFLSSWLVAAIFTLMTLSFSLYDAGLYHQAVNTLLDWAGNLRFFFNLGTLLLKTGFIIMQQPLFWGSVGVAVVMAWLWAKGTWSLWQRNTETYKLFL